MEEKVENELSPNEEERKSTPEFLRLIYKRHVRGAFVRSGGALVMGTFALLAYFLGTIRETHLAGVAGSILYLVFINPPTLFVLKRLASNQAIRFFSLFINFLEILGYTSVMYFLGGIEAAYLTPIYGIVISYVGIVAPRTYPFIVAGLCSICYAFMIFAQYLDFLPAFPVTPGLFHPLAQQMIYLSVVIGLLFVTAFASSYTATVLKKSRERLRRQNLELEGAVAERTASLREANFRLEQELDLRRRTEKMLKTSEEKYRLIFENSFDVIYTVDSQFRALSVSPSVKNTLGYDPEELLGKPFWELGIIAPEYLKSALADSLRVLSGEKIQPSVYELIAKDGSRRWGEISGAPLQRDGKVDAWISIGRDITERKRAEDELRRARDELEVRVRERTKELREAQEAAEAANRAKSEFLANMSHELRTPLNAIIGFTELVVDGQAGSLNKTQREYLHDVLGSSRHLLSLINDVLDLAKVEAGKMDLEIKNVSLRDILEGSLVMVKEKALKHRIRVTMDLNGVPGEVEADERKLKQVFYNLLSNAVKFTPDGGRVEVRGDLVSRQNGVWLERNGADIQPPADIDIDEQRGRDWVFLSVADTGIGIQERDLERIFSPFEQVDGSSSRRYAGTGLGLSLARQIVELHGGKIWAESEGLGKGSRFRFAIPLRRNREEGGR